MAVTRLTPYIVGETISVPTVDGKPGTVEVFAPDQLYMRVPAPRGRARIELNQWGVWRIDGRDYDVLAAAPVDEDEPQQFEGPVSSTIL